MVGSRSESPDSTTTVATHSQRQQRNGIDHTEYNFACALYQIERQRHGGAASSSPEGEGEREREQAQLDQCKGDRRSGKTDVGKRRIECEFELEFMRRRAMSVKAKAIQKGQVAPLNAAAKETPKAAPRQRRTGNMH